MVTYYRSPTAVSTVVAFMTQIHNSLVTSGWVVEFLDTDAIGTGTVGLPAWDKTPVIGADAGIAVYKMPMIDSGDLAESPWYVRIRPGWGSGTTRPQILGVTIGNAVDEFGNVSGGPTEITPTISSAVSHTSFFTVASYEHGFFFEIHLTNGTHLHIERVYNYAATVVQNELLFVYSNNTHLSGKVTLAGTIPYDYFFILTNHDGSATTTQVVSTISRDGATSFVPGPFFPGGDPFHWHPRLACLMPNNEVTANQDVLIEIDGGAKLYRAIPINLSTTLGRWVVAME